ncbi:MAG: hypothetical protein APF78_06210 [Sphingomonadales bacterium BRH_c3]|nr:MAG: hypothetical protein APF78_06210 [Sphingomonadales bacterium BRH_c3]
MKIRLLAVPLALAMVAAPLSAQAAGDDDGARGAEPSASQEEGLALSIEPPARPRSIFAGDWIALGAGFVYANSYSGSDESRVIPVPVVAGNYKGIGVRPRAAGLSFNFLETMRGDVTFSAGPIFRFRSDRAGTIKDDVVAAAGKLETAIEVGGQAGVTFNGVFTGYDRVSAGIDVLFDVAGAHRGTIIDPGISYSTPLGPGTIVALSAGAQYVDGDFADYYYSVTPAQSAASGLPEFDADSGWHKAGATLAMGFDLNENFRDGGLIFGGALGYRRMLGDAAATPFTSLRGDADQLTAIFGVAYVF